MPDVSARYGKCFNFIEFFWVFSYIIDEYSCLKYCIFTKLLQIVCLINIDILECQYLKCDCWLWKVLRFNCIFWVLFIYYYMFETIYLHQTFTNCMLRQKCRNEKLPYVSIYGYVGLVFSPCYYMLN